MTTKPLKINFKKFVIITSFILFIIDQVSKIIVDKTMEANVPITVIPGFFNLLHVRNKGAAWGILDGYTIILGIISLLATVFIIYNLKELVEDKLSKAISISLLLGGILGNLVDRFLRQEVVDFFHFYYKNFSYPVFNIADICICCGVAIQVYFFFVNKDEENTADTTSQADIKEQD